MAHTHLQRALRTLEVTPQNERSPRNHKFGQTLPRGTDRQATDAGHLPILARREDATCFMTDQAQSSWWSRLLEHGSTTSFEPTATPFYSRRMAMNEVQSPTVFVSSVKKVLTRTPYLCFDLAREQGKTERRS
jgi:hypothetical protein